MKISIDKAPAGPEMDAVVAKELDWREGFVHTVTGDPLLVPPESAKRGFEVDRAGNAIMLSWSTDIAAAWELVEQLVQSNPLQDIHLEHLEHTGWGVSSCYDEAEGGWNGWVYAETAPLAICRALLKAKGVEYVEIPDGESEKRLLTERMFFY